MHLFHRRPKPVAQHDCRYRDAWRSARQRAAAGRVRMKKASTALATASRDRARLGDELAAARTAADELLRHADSRQARGLPVWHGSDGTGLAARVVDAERRAAEAVQRAGLAEKRANRLDELLARAEGRPHAVPEPA